jgi:hypothetical protein
MNVNKGQFITEVEALKKAKKFFSRGYNQFDCPKTVKTGEYPKGLCKYFDELHQKEYISYTTKEILVNNTMKAVDDAQSKTANNDYLYNYFPTNADRLNYLNSAIKELDK